MTILVIILVLALLIQIWCWHFVFQKAADRTTPMQNHEKNTPFLSVVVCFHTPHLQVPPALPLLAAQTYSEYELIVVNDGPVELGENPFLHFLNSNDTIKYIEHKKTLAGKKQALFAGIQAAKGDWIAVTDIDCIPPPHWLSSLARHTPSHPAIILGYSPYAYKPGFLNFIIRQETLLTAFQYLGWAEYGKAYMGVGRNMVSHKSIYLKLTFESHIHVPTGDDDLFVNQAASDFQVMICNDPESFVRSQPKEHWKDWIRQKIRHNSGGKYYNWSSRIRISLFMVALVVEKLVLTWLLFVRIDLFILFTGLKMIVTFVPLKNLYQKLDKKSHFWHMWVYEWIHVIYLIIVSPYIFFLNKKQWD